MRAARHEVARSENPETGIYVRHRNVYIYIYIAHTTARPHLALNHFAIADLTYKTNGRSYEKEKEKNTPSPLLDRYIMIAEIVSLYHHRNATSDVIFDPLYRRRRFSHATTFIFRVRTLRELR